MSPVKSFSMNLRAITAAESSKMSRDQTPNRRSPKRHFLARRRFHGVRKVQIAYIYIIPAADVAKDAFFDELQSYRGLRRQLNVLDANTFTIKHAVSRPSIMLHGFCCDEIVAPFLETFSDTKKGVLQNALIERADFLHRAPRGAPEGYP